MTWLLWREPARDRGSALVEIHLEQVSGRPHGKSVLKPPKPVTRPVAAEDAQAVSESDSVENTQGSGETVGARQSWIIGPEKPLYPAVSRRRGEEGELVVSVQIDPSGSILKTVLIRSSGFLRLDQAGLDYLNAIQFGFSQAPATIVTKRLSLVFRLNP